MRLRDRHRQQIGAHAPDHEAIFTPQYAKSSGFGSTPVATVVYRQFLEAFIKENSIKSVLDMPCGDFGFMHLVDLNGASYSGYDIIKKRVAENNRIYANDRISFQCQDVRNAPVPDGTDLVLIKDMLQHWSNAEVIAFLGHLKCRKFGFALVTNSVTPGLVNIDTKSGGWRALDLRQPPFMLEAKEVLSFHAAPTDLKLVLQVNGG